MVRHHFLATQPQARVFPCTVRILVRSLPCFVSVSQWRRLLPAFSASSGLCCRSFPCSTEHWTELESENEPPRKRKRLSLLTGDGGRRVGAPSGSLSFGCSKSLERRLASLSVSVLRPYQSLKPPPLKNAMRGDDWIVQTNLLAIDIGRVVHFGSLCEGFALFELRES